MSKTDAFSAHTIPTGILVGVSGAACKPERPVLKRKVGPRTRARQVPWLWIVTGSSAAWALLILAIALCTPTHKISPRGEPQAKAQPSASVTTAPASAPKPMVRENAKAELAAKPIAEAPMPALAESLEVRIDIAAPAIPISPVMVETIAADEMKPQEPKVALAPSPLERRDISPFASCERIGTNILFMKDPPEAFKRAKAENKLVFMVHLSGNLEDPGFT